MPTRQQQAKALQGADTLCVLFVVAAYAATLLRLLLVCGPSALFWETLLIPAVAYIALGALRSAIDAPRPYDDPSFQPLLKPNKTGKSFPSRHVSSGAVISLAIMASWLPVGIACLVATMGLAAIRVAGGLHFTRDVLAGFFLGALFGLLVHLLQIL